MAKIIWKGVAKKDDPIYVGGFIISYPKRKSSAYLDKTDNESQKNNKEKGLKMKKKKNNLEILYERMLKKYDKDDNMMKSLKRQINESKLPTQSFENAYITGRIRREND